MPVIPQQFFTFLRNHSFGEIGIGFVLVILSTLAAVLFRFPYFYSTFVTGMFLVFDGWEYILHKHTFLDTIFPYLTVKNIVIFILLGLCIDGLFGRLIFRMWVYPYYTNIFNDILLYVIVYPVGGLSLVEMYNVSHVFLAKVFTQQASPTPALESFVKNALRIITFLYPVAFLLPIIFFLLGLMQPLAQHRLLYSLFILVIMGIWAFIFDIITVAYHGKPLLLDVLLFRKDVLLSIVLTGIVAGSLHEYVNTYAHEWRYVDSLLPFTPAHILGVPIVVFLGWILGTALCVSLQKAVTTFISKH